MPKAAKKTLHKNSPDPIPTPPAPYSPPEFSCDIWLDDDGNIRLGLRSLHGTTGHSLRISQSLPAEAQIKALRKILTDRAAAKRPTIGQAGAPIQAMLDALLRSDLKPKIVELNMRMELDDFRD